MKAERIAGAQGDLAAYLDLGQVQLAGNSNTVAPIWAATKGTAEPRRAPPDHNTDP